MSQFGEAVPVLLDLPRLSNAEFEEVARLAELSGTPLEVCPTCGSQPEPLAPDVYARPEKTCYRYRGETHICDCELQILLRKHYLLANIGDQYMRLDWAEYEGSQKARDMVAEYLDKWSAFKRNGMGLEFNGRKLGVGKTFAATHVGKELIKRGERVFFIPFLEVISAYENEHRHALEERLRNTTVLILDEVVPPHTHAQGGLFSSKFEELIRHRTNFNRITIMTTNLEPDMLRETYPRTYSLLEAKQMRVTMEGTDWRMSVLDVENLELSMNDEVRPIT